MASFSIYDPMIIDGSVNHHLWRHNLGDAHHSNVVKVFGTTFKNVFAYEEVEGAIEENINIATQNGKKMTHWRKLFESPNGPKYILTMHYDSLSVTYGGGMSLCTPAHSENFFKYLDIFRNKS